MFAPNRTLYIQDAFVLIIIRPTESTRLTRSQGGKVHQSHSGLRGSGQCVQHRRNFLNGVGVALVCGLGGARISRIFGRVFAEQNIIALSVREDGLQESLDVAQALFAQLVFVVNFGE